MFPDNDGDFDELEIDLKTPDGKKENYKHEVQDEIALEELDSDDDVDDDKQDDIKYETKDLVQKYHFEYNKSLCMWNKYPEVSTNEDEHVNPIWSNVFLRVKSLGGGR